MRTALPHIICRKTDYFSDVIDLAIKVKNQKHTQKLMLFCLLAILVPSLSASVGPKKRSCGHLPRQMDKAVMSLAHRKTYCLSTFWPRPADLGAVMLLHLIDFRITLFWFRIFLQIVTPPMPI